MIDDSVATMHENAADVGGPLDGLLVVDFCQLVAGPLAAMVLADLGARVVKVEPPAGDSSRSMDATSDGSFLGVYETFNRDKQSIVLDLRNEADHAVALALLDRADVMLEASRVGAMDRLGLGYDTLSERNPGLIYVSVNGYGDRGPNAERGAVDLAVQAEAGWMDITGEPDGPAMKIGAVPIDAATGYVAAQGVLAALLMRHRTGRGDHLKVSLYDVACHMHAQDFTQYLSTGRAVTRTGNFPRMSTPAGVYETADGTIVLAAYLPHHWAAVLDVFDDDELREDPRFATYRDRVKNRAALLPKLQTIMRTRTTAQWSADFERARVTNAIVRNIEQATSSDQFDAAELRLEVKRDGRSITTLRNPVRYGAIRSRSHTAASRLDADRADVLREFAPDMKPVDSGKP